MKKHLAVNTLVFLSFIVSEPLLTRCGDWADTYSLGAEMVLGMLIPLIFTMFILFAILSVSLALYKAIVTKDIKQTIPILVLIAFITLYITLSTQDSLWVRFIEYCKINNMA